MMKLLLTLEELCEVLKVAPRTIQFWQSRGRIPSCIRLGRSPRWRVDEIEQWVARGCPTCTDMQQDAIHESADDDDSDSVSL